MRPASPGESSANEINDVGEIVGGDGRPFWYSSGQVTHFGNGGTANAINNRGEIVGYSDFGSSHNHAFYTAGQLMDLGTLGGSTGGANSINSAGDVVGSSRTLNDAAPHAFLYAGGKMTDIGTLGGKDATAYGINASGKIVGTLTNVTGIEEGAFLYANRAMTNPDAFLPEASDWTLDAAYAIMIKARSLVSGIVTGIRSFRNVHSFSTRRPNQRLCY